MEHKQLGTLFTIYIKSILFLFLTVCINLVANWLTLDTWYSFLSRIDQQGIINGVAQTSVASWAFLFFVYPLLLYIIFWGLTHKDLSRKNRN